MKIRFTLAFVLSVFPLSLSALTTVVLPGYEVFSPEVAIPRPAGSTPQPVTSLRFLPQVDVQARNLAETQADVTIRGGIFEGTGVKLGAVTLFDPQTGHYLTEIPLAPEFLDAPVILTGSGNAIRGFNATAGTIHFGVSAATEGGSLEGAVGTDAFWQARALANFEILEGWTVGAEVAHSEGDGSIENGDFDFERYTGRLQGQTALGRTTLLAGYQDKFFGWPNLYTPFGFDETESLQTTLVVLDHQLRDDVLGEGGWQVTAYYRKNRDDYEIERSSPGLFSPFEHETEVWAIGVEGNPTLLDDRFRVLVSAQALADSIESTDLVHGPFQSRAYFKAAAVPSWEEGFTNGTLLAQAGVTYDVTDREDGNGVLGGIARVQWRQESGALPWTVYAEIAEASQVPGHTVAGSSIVGFFAGNPNLGREDSRNWEVGGLLEGENFTVQIAVFLREDRGLVDWVFRDSFTASDLTHARAAEAADIDTLGVEILGAWQTERLRLEGGYTYLDKEESYASDDIVASFYGLNYAEHRGTLSAVVSLPAGFEVRTDVEGRIQAANALRTSEDEAVLVSALVAWRPEFVEGLEVWAVADNLFESEFEEVPGVPPPGRQVAAGARWTW